MSGGRDRSRALLGGLVALVVAACGGREKAGGNEAPAPNRLDAPADGASSSVPAAQALPPPPRIAPEIADVSAVDRDGDRVDDELERQVAELEARGGAQEATRGLEERIRVLVAFTAPVTRAELDTFAAHGGVLERVYPSIGYALRGTLPRGRATELAAAFDDSLLLVTGGHRLVRHLDEATRSGRVRPVWASDFAGGKGLSGSSSVNVAIVDTGVDGSHTDLAGREVFFHDYSADALTSAADVNGHGTHVAGIAVGSGAAFGVGPGTLLYTDSGDLTGLHDGSFAPHTLHLPASSLTFSSNATFASGNSMTTLGMVTATDGTDNWTLVGTGSSGVSPLAFSATITPAAGTRFSSVLSAPAGLFAVTASATNYPAVGDGFPALRGVAASSGWAGFKVFANDGSGDSLVLLDGLDGVLGEAEARSIKVVNMSLGTEGAGLDPYLRSVVNTLVKNGLVVVVSAGNTGPDGVVSDPGRARLALTVGAASDQNRVAEYSSVGFASPDASEGNKPDVLAPGGSEYRSMILAPDSNSADAESASFADRRANDYAILQGTSMAAPFVAGAAALVIEALESTSVTWTFADETQPLFVKMLLSASATETSGGREGGGTSPTLGRDGAAKDLVEGYGMVNPDAAVESLLVPLGGGFSGTTAGGPFDRRAWGRSVALSAGEALDVSLTVPATADFDLYLYDATPLDAGTSAEEGTPHRLAASATPGTGANETLSYTPASDGTAYLFVKRVSGNGTFTLTTSSSCGNGVVDAGEACDDGNTLDGDCCDTHCEPAADGTSCDDGDACTTTDRCSAGSCVGATPVTCTALDECHVAGVCNSGTGTCSDPQRPDGTPCTGGSCMSGSCVPGGAGGMGGSGGMDGKGGAAGGGAASGAGGTSGEAGAGRGGTAGDGGRGGTNAGSAGLAQGGLDANGGRGNAGDGGTGGSGGSSAAGTDQAGAAPDDGASGGTSGAAAGMGGKGIAPSEQPSAATPHAKGSKGCGCSVPTQRGGGRYGALGLGWLALAARRRRRGGPRAARRRVPNR